MTVSAHAPALDTSTSGAAAESGRPRDPDLILARLHLRLGLLSLARTELETLAGRGGLDDEAIRDLAEARWRTGDVAGAGEAASAWLEGHPDDILGLVIAAIGAVIILIGILAFVIQIAVSIINRDKLRDTTGDPWNGRTLEWSTSSPPPNYNFAFTPQVHDLDAWYDMKDRGAERPVSGFRAIHMPRNTGAGVILSGLALALGFAMVWYIWWLAVVSLIGLFVVGIAHTFNYNRDYHIPAEEVAEQEDARTTLLAAGA